MTTTSTTTKTTTTTTVSRTTTTTTTSRTPRSPPKPGDTIRLEYYRDSEALSQCFPRRLTDLGPRIQDRSCFKCFPLSADSFPRQAQRCSMHQHMRRIWLSGGRFPADPVYMRRHERTEAQRELRPGHAIGGASHSHPSPLILTPNNYLLTP